MPRPGDLKAGVFVALLALPLSLGIAVASGLPASAGLLTSIVGGLVIGLVGGARYAIKGPAAGLIVLVLAAVTDLGVEGALAVFFVSGLVQVAIGLTAGARWIRWVPESVVRGMLVAIGAIVLIKQVPVMLGALEASSGWEPRFAVVGLATLGVWLASTALARRFSALARVPAPLLAITVGALIAALVGSSVTAPGLYPSLPTSLSGWWITPDFAVLLSPRAWLHVGVLAGVGSVESLLTLRAVDALSGERCDAGRDLALIGLGNALAASIGGMPMISEVVRSSANLGHGARTRFGNVTHGAVLLVLVAAAPGLIEALPLPALAALLVVVAARLASPTLVRVELSRALGAGETVLGWSMLGSSLAVRLTRGRVFALLPFVATLALTVAVDLLVGVVAGTLLALLGRRFGAEAGDAAGGEEDRQMGPPDANRFAIGCPSGGDG